MRVVSVISLGAPQAGMYRIELSEGSLFSLKGVYLAPEYDPGELCVVDKILSDREEEALRFAASCLRAERQALRLVARAEQTSRGLSRKLRQGGHAAPCVAQVVAYLTEQAIISDYRYAQLWLRARLSRKVESPRQLMAALCSRSIDRDTAQEALAEVLEPDTEWALLTRYVAKTPPPPDGFSIRQTLKYQGFSPLVIDRACCHLPWRCIED